MLSSTTSVLEALEAATAALDEAGVDNARFDAELLLAEAMGGGRESLYADSEEQLDASAARRFASMVRRRLRREPVAYILGRAGFRRLTLAVDRQVLIPRPETELLVEQARNGDRVLDVGTGSGAVALAVADELQGVDVTATDRSVGALEVARLNAARLGLAVTFVEADLLTDGVFDLVVSNPPYVRKGEWPDLQPEITRYEPREALVAGRDGLEVITRLIAGAPAVMAEGSRIAIEVGAGQAPEVVRLIQQRGFIDAHAERDLAGIERVVCAEWPG